MTLGCLAPYRRLGIGTVMVQHVMDIVEKDGNYDSIFLHVQVNQFRWKTYNLFLRSHYPENVVMSLIPNIYSFLQVNNEDAINFYKNFGFDIVETKQQYYKRIEPADAYVLEKKLKSSNDKSKHVTQVNGVNS